MARFTTPFCATATISILSSVTFSVSGFAATDVGGTSITIGLDGNPVIINHKTLGGVYIAACDDPGCATGSMTYLGNAISPASITIGATGYPVIAYDPGSSGIGIIACTNPACTTSSSSIIGTRNGQHAALAIGVDDNPVVAYRDTGGYDLAVAVCGNPTCAPYAPRNR